MELPAIAEACGRVRRGETLLEKGEKLPGVAAVSLDRASRQAPLAGEMLKPGGGRRRQVRRGGEDDGVSELGHDRRMRARA